MLERIFLLLLNEQNLTVESLAEKLSSQPQSIKAAITELIKRGVVIEEDSQSGLLSSALLPLLSTEIIFSLFNQQQLKLIDVDYRFEVDSTNQVLLDRLPDPEKLCICTAEWQSQGRGRQGREWVSPLGQNLMFSMARHWLQNHALVDNGMLNILSLMAGVAVVLTLTRLGLAEVKLKWPNDIVVDNADNTQLKKIGGILVELKGNSKQGVWVTGIGLNVADDNSWHQQVDQQITSLGEITQGDFSREELLAGIIETWLELEEILLTTGTEAIIDEWRQFDVLLNKAITVYPNYEEPYEAIARGIDCQGKLQLERTQSVTANASELILLHSGEVKVRINHAAAS